MRAGPLAALLGTDLPIIQAPMAGSQGSALAIVVSNAGGGDFSPLWCGQNASGCREVAAAQMTRELGAGL